MFNKSIEQRLNDWIVLRKSLDDSLDPLQDVWDFWHCCPFIPFNKDVDPYYQQSWPSPWEIIVKNRYDDFTKALMISWTLKLTKKFSDASIEIKTMVDCNNDKQYNLVFIDNKWIINFDDNGPTEIQNLNESLKIENIVEIPTPR